MAVTVLLYGASSSGKSSSARDFASDELALINVISKPLPFRGKFDSTLETDDIEKIIKAINSTTKKSIMIDDAGYLITNYFMKNHSSAGQGNGVFSLYNDLGDRFWTLLNVCNTRIAPDKIVYIVMHEEESEFGKTKPKTIGKLLDEKVCVEGMFTIVLHSKVDDKGEHIFEVQSDGTNVAKSPMDMFSGSVIPNDLKAVDNTIREFYGIMPIKEKGEK